MTRRSSAEANPIPIRTPPTRPTTAHPMLQIAELKTIEGPQWVPENKRVSPAQYLRRNIARKNVPPTPPPPALLSAFLLSATPPTLLPSSSRPPVCLPTSRLTPLPTHLPPPHPAPPRLAPHRPEAHPTPPRPIPSHLTPPHLAPPRPDSRPDRPTLSRSTRADPIRPCPTSPAHRGQQRTSSRTSSSMRPTP